MKKFLTIIFILLITNIVSYAESTNDTNDAWNNAESAGEYDGQKSVTDDTFNKTIKMLKERQLTNRQKKEQRRVQPLSPSASPEHLKDFATMADGDDIAHTLTVMIPVLSYTEYGDIIMPGYYKLSCKKTRSNGYVLQLTQDTNTVYTINAIQTKEDLEQETINFCNAELEDDNKTIKLVYGNLGLNLVGYIFIK